MIGETMDHKHFWFHWALVAGTICLLSQIQMAESLYPNKTPFMDMCVGTKKTACQRVKKKNCVWKEIGAPDCFEKKYFFIKPAREQDPLDTVVRFFEFSYGVHLSEGTNQQIHVVSEVGECAQACLASTGVSGIRCLSFDYYPHEHYDPTPPFFETQRSGYCILNSENADTARLRNSDMGVTDSELFYKSHFTRRPFSGEEGYYQLRDVRGGEISRMLEYTPKGVQFNANNLWPRSRWGLMYLDVPIEVATGYICDEPDTEPYNASAIIDPAVGSSVEFSRDATGQFSGAFTPVDNDQHCVGRINKPKAAELCAQSGGYLCSPTELKLSRLSKLGCNLDDYAMWSATDKTPKGNGTTKFVRCCSKFYVLNICPFFTRTQMDFCGSLADESACVSKGSGQARQTQSGFGKLRDYYKTGCANGNLPCKGLLSNWRSRDSCIWCPKPGGLEGGTGECRAGNDIGVCPNAPLDMQKLYALKIKAQCTSKTICRIATRYEEKAVLFDAHTPRPTSSSPTIPTESPTRQPSKSPTFRPTPPTKSPSKAPTKSPSFSPTTSKPSATPSRTPTTSKPSKAPSHSPTTSKPTNSPSKTPTLSSPTHSPSTSTPSSTPSSQPSTAPPEPST